MTHLAARVRHLANNIADNTEKLDRNRELAQHLAAMASLLWEHGDDVFARASDWADTGIVSGGQGSGSSSSPATPTEREALASYRDDGKADRPDLTHDQQLAGYDRWLRFHRSHIEMSAGPMLKILTDMVTLMRRDIDPHPGMVKITDPVTGRENHVPQCAEYWCEDAAPNARLGRCDPCRKWIERWLENNPGKTTADCPPVPRHVIGQRAIKRRRAAA